MPSSSPGRALVVRALRGLVVSASLSACAAACGPASPPSRTTGHGWMLDARATPDAGAPPGSASAPAHLGRWELADAWRAFAIAAPRGPSQHLRGDVEGEVRVSPAASGYAARGPGRTLAEGAVVVESHHPPGRDETTSLFAMIKRAPGFDPAGGDWEYLVAGADGEVEARGRLPLCARCHAEAAYDHLFGVPQR